MNQAHQILGVPADASEEAIRSAYLQKVREHPPERDPDGFANVRQAYEALRDPVARVHGVLFAEPQPMELQPIIGEMKQQPIRMSADALLGLGN